MNQACRSEMQEPFDEAVIGVLRVLEIEQSIPAIPLRRSD